MPSGVATTFGLPERILPYACACAALVDLVTFTLVLLFVMILAVPVLPFLALYGWLGLRRTFRLAKPPILLCLQPGLAEAYTLHKDDILGCFTSELPQELILLDPAGTREMNCTAKDGTSILSWATPKLCELLFAMGLRETSAFLRELVVVPRLAIFVARRGIYCIRTMQHEHSALRGGIVGALLRLPLIIEVAGNYEMLRRIKGRTIYFSLISRLYGLRTLIRLGNDWLLGWPMRRAFYVIGRNKNNYEHAFALGAPVERLTLIRIRMTSCYNSPEKSGQRPLEGRYMLFVARMAPEKFPLDVLKVFQKLAGRYEDLRLVMIGDGTEFAAVKRMRETMSCRERVLLTGSLPSNEVLRWTQHASLAFETYSGSALAEKLLCRVPVVAYDVEWMSEVVIEGYTGHLARFRNIDDAFDGCCRILDHPDQAAQQALRGSELANVLFSAATIGRQERLLLEDAWSFAKNAHASGLRSGLAERDCTPAGSSPPDGES